MKKFRKITLERSGWILSAFKTTIQQNNKYSMSDTKQLFSIDLFAVYVAIVGLSVAIIAILSIAN